MTMIPPTAEQLGRIARDCGLALNGAELAGLAGLCAGLKFSYDRLDALSEPHPTVKYPRSAGRPPRESENPINAWAWLCDIDGAPDGPLKGARVGIKDNICVAGLPMRNGSRLFEGFVPDIDATVVTRILDAGGTITGKTVCEDLCFSGSSHTSQPLPVLNPFDPGRSAGGSSSGNAAAIAAGDVTMCVGGDQGGSVRTPASWSGVVGLKPTHGLVPYTGAFPIEPSLDHLGPMGRNVCDVARLLSVIAGADGLDPRQRAVIGQDYLSALREPLKGLKIGVIREGFGRPESNAANDAMVRRALGELARAGAAVEDVSIPWHLDGYHLTTAVVMEGAAAFMFAGDAMGVGFDGYYPTSLAGAWSQSWRARPGDLPDIGKLALLFQTYMQETYRGRFYGKAQNLRRTLRAAYDTALASYDVLALPTTPFTATLLPPPGITLEEKVAAGLDMEGNTAPFDASGHPALSIPCGLSGGLPVGLMFVARHFAERNVLRAAAGFESLGDWKTM
jgi:amidase